MLGTPDYMTPEQWENTHGADARSDLYTMGCTLFFLLTGQAPFADEKHSSLVGKMKGHTLDPIPDLQAARRKAVPIVPSWRTISFPTTSTRCIASCCQRIPKSDSRRDRNSRKRCSR